MARYAIDREFSICTHLRPVLCKPAFVLINPLLRALAPRSGASMRIRRLRMEGFDRAGVRALFFEPAGLPESAPCLVYFHGGAFLIQAAPYHYRLAREYAAGAGCKVLFVDYRLTTKCRFPIPAEDCFSAFEWALAHADSLGIDRSRIAVAGDSAGGNLAAAVCLMARDRKTAPPCFQMLIYPVIDRRMQSPSMRAYRNTPMWNSRLSQKMWRLYLPKGRLESASYASPIEADSLANLPDAYIETAQFDCLRDEAAGYAAALSAAGSQVELRQTKGTVHGFDMISASKLVQTCVRQRIHALCQAFSIGETGN